MLTVNNTSPTAGADSDPNRLPFLAIVLVGCASRLAYLFQPLRYDEAVSYLDFARQPLSTLLTDYRLPNNHIFHSLLVGAFTAVFGDDAWAIRLPAFLAGCAAIPLTYSLARRLSGDVVALLSSALVAGSGALTLYSTNARGYSLVMLAMLVLYWILLDASTAARPWHWPLFAIVTALGCWTIPIMLYPLGGVICWAALAATTNRAAPPRIPLRSAALALVGGGVCASMLYLPVVLTSGIDVLVANNYVTSTNISRLLFEDLPAGLSLSWQLLSLGLPGAVAIPLLGLTCLGAAVHVVERRRLPPVLAALLWSLVLLVVMRRFPVARVWLFFVPLIAISCAEGAEWLLQKIPVNVRVARRGVGSLLVAVALAAGLMLSQAIPGSRETGTLYDAEALARRIRDVVRPGDRVVVASWAPLMYWLERLGVDQYLVLGEEASAARAVVVVNLAEGESVTDALVRFGPLSNLVVDTVGTFPHAILVTVTPR